MTTTTAFDLCTTGQHFSICGPYRPFVACDYGSHWHHVSGSSVAYRLVGLCPADSADQPCEPVEDEPYLISEAAYRILRRMDAA